MLSSKKQSHPFTLLGKNGIPSEPMTTMMMMMMMVMKMMMVMMMNI
jgi:hypothetical protein